jgi:hypothetical protein
MSERQDQVCRDRGNSRKVISRRMLMAELGMLQSHDHSVCLLPNEATYASTIRNPLIDAPSVKAHLVRQISVEDGIVDLTGHR